MSSSAEPSTPDKEQQLTGKQVQLLSAVMSNCGKLDINWENVASQAGYKNAASAREVYRVTAKRLGWGNGGGGGGTPTSAGGGGRGGGHLSSGPTPTKVQKTTAGKVGSAKKRGGGAVGRLRNKIDPHAYLMNNPRLVKREEEDDDDDEEEEIDKVGKNELMRRFLGRDDEEDKKEVGLAHDDDEDAI